MTKPTIATVKSFIKKNRQALFIKLTSSFDSQSDSVVNKESEFELSKEGESINEQHDFGVRGAWFVGNSRDYISVYDQPGFSGYRIVNSCGAFVLAVKNDNAQ